MSQDFFKKTGFENGEGVSRKGFVAKIWVPFPSSYVL
jgi:hypothetical protein